MITTGNEKSLPSERYDAKLFNQVYRANLKAKGEKKESESKKKRLYFSLGVGILSLLVLSFLLFKPNAKENFVSTFPSVDAYTVDIPLPVATQYPVLDALEVENTSASVLVYDLNSNKELFSKNADEKLQVASLTKLVTVMVMIDTYGLDYQLEITKDIPEDLEWLLGLEKGDVISTDQLLIAMLISSYNDAAYVVANEYGFEKYIELMNEKVNELGCEDTNFDNPMGYDSGNHFSTANDLKKIVNLALRYRSLLETAQSHGANVSWVSQGGKVEKYIYTTNKMVLDFPNVRGLKTGFTKDAGECLITLYDNLQGNRFVVILLNSEDRFGETEQIIKKILY